MTAASLHTLSTILRPTLSIPKMPCGVQPRPLEALALILHVPPEALAGPPAPVWSARHRARPSPLCLCLWTPVSLFPQPELGKLEFAPMAGTPYIFP